MSACMYPCKKEAKKSQYLSEISVWNHEWPDLSLVMEPDGVSGGFPINRRERALKTQKRGRPKEKKSG